MSRSLLVGLALLLLAGCDQTTRTVEPFEVVFYLQSGGEEREVLRREVPRNALQAVPLTVPIPRSATGFLVGADIGPDSLGFVGVVRPERLDIYDLPRSLVLTGDSPSLGVSRGPGGPFQPLLVFSTDGLWVDDRAAATLSVSYGPDEQRRALSRAEGVVPAAVTVTAADLGLSGIAVGGVRLRAEVEGARDVEGLVAVLLATNAPEAILPTEGPIQAEVLYRDPTDGDRLVLPRGSGVLARTGFEADDEQVVSLVLLRAE